jgi:hypothetical protein
MEGCGCFGERLADLETVMADKESTHVETLEKPFDFNGAHYSCISFAGIDG